MKVRATHLDRCTMTPPRVIFPQSQEKKRIAFDLQSNGGSMCYYVALTPDDVRTLYAKLLESEEAKKANPLYNELGAQIREVTQEEIDWTF